MTPSSAAEGVVPPPPARPTSADIRPFEHVIVPFDNSADAQRAAVVGSDLADLLHTDLVLATMGDSSLQPGSRTKRRAQSLSDDAATIWVEPGRSVVAALSTMTRYRPQSLICLATHARTGVLRAVYGNLAEQLLRDLEVPVLLLGPRCREPKVAAIGHIVVCVDHSPASVTAVSLAASWARHQAVNATIAYAQARDEIAADINELILPLEQRCAIVKKVSFPRDAYLDGVLDIVTHSTSSLIVVAAHMTSGLGRLHHDRLVTELSLRSPVPVLVRRAAEG